MWTHGGGTSHVSRMPLPGCGSICAASGGNRCAKAHGEMPGTQRMFNDKLRSQGFNPDQIKALGTKGCRGIRLKPTSHWQEDRS